MSTLYRNLTENLGDWAELSLFETLLPPVLSKLAQEYAKGDEIWPRSEAIFRALQLCQRHQTRVVILGQDPYPTPNDADGLAFSAANAAKMPRSLQNITKELEADLGQTLSNADLTHWAKQGVLLLNTTLTVRAGAAGSHRALGWQTLTQAIVTTISQQRPCVFILWGKNAQSLECNIESYENHLILKSAHPSPLSARRGFFESRPFSQTNAFLTAKGVTPIRWGTPLHESPN